METTRPYTVGNKVVMPIPHSIAKDLDLDREYSTRMDDYGTITLIPILKNPFKDVKTGEYYEEDMWEDMEPTGDEVW